jgi:hypothetical protein
MISGKLSDLMLLSQYIPVTVPLNIAGETWFRFMDRDSIKSLFSYMWYAVLDQYIDFTETEMETAFTSKTTRRGQVKASKNLVAETELKKMVASLLLIFIETMDHDKSLLNISYNEIMKKVDRDKDVEKRSMMARFENVSNSDLRYVNMEKRYKIGRWLMEDVHKYKKTRYENEKREELKTDEMLYDELIKDGTILDEADVQEEHAPRNPVEEMDDIDDNATADLFDEYGEDTDQMDLDREYASDDELDFEGDF